MKMHTETYYHIPIKQTHRIMNTGQCIRMYNYYINILSIQTSFDVNVSNKLSSGVARLQKSSESYFILVYKL